MSEVNPAVAALIARYRSTPAAVPNVNPPEAAKVLESQTAPEIAAVPAPAAAEPPKAKRGPGRPPRAAAPAAEPEQLTAGSVGLIYATTERIVAELRDRGYRVTLEER